MYESKYLSQKFSKKQFKLVKKDNIHMNISIVFKDLIKQNYLTKKTFVVS